MKKHIFYIGLSLIIFISCEKDNINSDADITLNSWKVIKMQKPEDLTYLNASENYIFKFINNTTFTFNLDVNSCGGQYRIISKGNIEIQEYFCTEMCCDSEYAEELLELIPKMTKYYFGDNKLIFEGDGEIIFEKYN